VAISCEPATTVGRHQKLLLHDGCYIGEYKWLIESNRFASDPVIAVKGLIL
jgi:hypothetical protein